jgi:MFS family permease
MLIISAILAPLSTAVLPLAVALFLLGLGWNFCFVGGSALLSDQLSPSEQSKTQGANDLILGWSTAFASISSGLVYASTNYTFMGYLVAVLSLIPIGMTGWWMVKTRTAAHVFPTAGSIFRQTVSTIKNAH